MFGVGPLFEQRSSTTPSDAKCLCSQVAWQATTTPALGDLEEVDLRGKRVLITGATSGLGLWQAEAESRRNASLLESTS